MPSIPFTLVNLYMVIIASVFSLTCNDCSEATINVLWCEGWSVSLTMTCYFCISAQLDLLQLFWSYHQCIMVWRVKCVIDSDLLLLFQYSAWPATIVLKLPSMYYGVKGEVCHWQWLVIIFSVHSLTCNKCSEATIDSVDSTLITDINDNSQNKRVETGCGAWGSSFGTSVSVHWY